MSCWKILEIKHTTDQKLIKRAYATKLKSNRPDENPTAFTELHSAYKQALNIAKNDADENNLTENTISTSTETTQLETNGTELSNDIIEEVDELEVAWQQMTETVHKILADPNIINLESSWNFLQNNEALINIEFKNSFSDYVFYYLLEYYESVESEQSLKSPESNPTLSEAVTNYLDNIFDWTYNRDLLENNYGYDAVDSVLRFDPESNLAKPHKWISAKQHVGPLIYGNYYARLSAELVDIGVFAFIYLFIQKYSNNNSSIENMLIPYIVISLLIRLTMEASPLQATFGKLLFGLKVVSLTGTRLTLLHAILRQLLFVLSSAAFKITVWINLLINDGRLLHDRISRSIVIKSES